LSCLGYWTTRGYAIAQIADSRTSRLANWASHGLDSLQTTDQPSCGLVSLQTGQLADHAASRKQHHVLLVNFFRYHQHHRLHAHKLEEQNMCSEHLIICKITTPCLKKIVPPSTCYSLDVHDPITTIFGRSVTEKV